MSSIEKRSRNGHLRWYVRYRDPTAAQRTKVFDRRVDAERYLTKVDASKLVGGYVDPRAAARLFRDVAEEHFAAHTHNLAADTTRVVKRSRLDRHILPVLGNYPIGSIKPSTMSSAVSTWSSTLAPGTVGQVLRQVRQILDAALADGLVSANVAKLVKPPTAPGRRDVHLHDEDVRKVIDATSIDYRALVITLVDLGLRLSEACGLRVSDVDFLRKVVHVRQQRRPGGELGALKTSASWRDVPADDAVLGLAEQIRRRPRRDGLVFSSGSSPAGPSPSPATCSTTSVPLRASTSHRTRCGTTSGSSLISQGVSIVAVSKWLGHSSPEITWRVYSYLMATDEEVGRGAMSRTFSKLLPDVYPLCTADGHNGL
ncbi:MAG: tyrosine-type recombinase/integrase [Jatrophihabitans sp.]|uniref:tyrosine-type recombinase/integrase n=1 Tax=Jatrophihabitans sp. TaxID=1932789 RepID=UPI003913B0D4